MITALPGYQVNAAGNGVVPIGTPASAPLPTYQATPVAAAPLASGAPGVSTPGMQAGVPQAPTTTTPTVTPPLQPQSEEDIYGNYVTQGQSIIDQINASTQAQIAAANSQVDMAASKSQQDQNALAGITGNFGSASAAGASQVAQTAASQKNTADSAISAQASQQVTQYLQQLQTAAQSEADFEQTTAFNQGQTYDQYLKTNAATTLQGLAKSGVTVQSLQAQAAAGNPMAQQTMQTLLQAYGGDQNALNAAAALATPVNQVQQSWSQGDTLYQLVTNPQTGVPSIQSFNLGVPIPQGSTVTKTGTNSSQVAFPDGSIGYITTDPLSGKLTFQGTGAQTSSAQVWAAQGNSANTTSTSGSSTTGTSSTTGSSSDTNYPTTFSSVTGVSDLSTPLNSDTIAANGGVGNVVAGIVAAEGGSAQGVTGNPGNILYTGAPGETDSDVHPTDNPNATFANFDPANNNAAGLKAIGDLVTSAASGTNANYGAAPTFQSFLSKYANLTGVGAGTGDTGAVGSNELSSSEYGSLANVSGFDPGTPGQSQTDSQIIDQGAFNYLQAYLSGSTPSSTGGMGGLPAKVYSSDVQARALQLYQDATGKPLPNAEELQNNLSLINGNNAMLTSLGINIPTITANAKLLEGKITAANINQNAPAINSIIDPIINALGNTAVASYMAQNSTLSNELGSLLALKNAGGAGGSTVHDKLAAAGLIDKNSSAAQIAATVNTILQEAGNAQAAIGQVNYSLYKQTDKLGIDPQNPLNNPMVFTDPTGNTVNFDKGSLTSNEVDALIANGYDLNYSTQ